MTPSVAEKEALDTQASSTWKLGNAERWACTLLALCFIGGFTYNVSDRGVVTAVQAGVVCAFALIFGYLFLTLVAVIIWGIHAAITTLLTKAYALAGEDFCEVKLSKGAKLVLSILGVCFLAGFACNVSDRGVATAVAAGIVWVFGLIFGYLFVNLAAAILWGISAGIKAIIRAV